MEITSRNLGVRKSLKLKYQDKPQTETEKQTPQTPAFKGGVPINGLKQLGRYGSAAMLMAGTMFMATSCEQTEVLHEETYNVYVQQKTEELEKLIQQLLNMNDKYYNLILDGQNKMISLLEQMNNANQANQSMILKIFAEYKDLLLKIKDNTDTNVQQTQEGLELYNQILSQLTKNNELLTQYGNEIVSYLGTIKTAIESGNDSIIAVLELLWADVVKGNSEIFEAVKTLGLIMETNNDELVETILDIYENSELSAAERNQAVLDAINDVKATVDNFQAIIGATTGDINAKLQEFLDSYNKNEITSQKMMELMYNALIEGNTLDKLQLEQLHQIWVKLEGGDVTIAEALKEIKDLLVSIDATLKDMSTQLDDILNRVVDLNADVKTGHQNISAKLDEIITNQGNNSESLKELINLNGTQNKLVEDMGISLKEAVSLLNKLYEKTGDVKWEDLKTLLTENNDKVVVTIESALKDLGVTIDESNKDAVKVIINALEEYKVILGDNKQALDTIINIISSIDLNTSLSNTQMEELIGLVKEFKALAESESVSQAEINAKLNEIKELLSNIDNTLTEIKDQLKDILAGINDINVKLDASQAEYVSYLEKLVNNTDKANEYLAALTTSQEKTAANSETLIAKANEAIELLKSADKKLGDLNYANLIAELKAMDAELAAELEEMIKNLGISINNNTNDAADQIIAALDAIKASLNANNADMKEVISQLSSLNLKADLNAQQMSELIKLVSALKATVEDSGATQDDISAKLDDIKEFLASIDNTLKDILATLESSAVKGNQQFEELKGILNKMNGNIVDVKANGAAILNKLDGLQAAATEIIAYLEQIEANQGDDITYAQLKELSGENLAAIEKMLENLKIDAAAYADAKIGDLIAAIKSSNIDLTTTNNLLQTIITIVSKLNGSSAAGNANTILQDLLNAYNSGNADLKALLEAANSKLDALYDQVVEIYNELSDLTSEFKTYSSLMDTSNKSILTKLDAVISDIEEGNSKLSALESQATVGNSYLNNALSKADEIIALLEKQGANSGNGGLTKAELEEVLADAGASLQTMLNNLGISINDNTDNAAAEIVAAIKSNKVDLTTTHNLLQSIITNTSTLVKLASNSNVTVDTSALEAKLDSLISSGSASQSELEALNKAVQDLIASL